MARPSRSEFADTLTGWFWRALRKGSDIGLKGEVRVDWLRLAHRMQALLRRNGTPPEEM